MTFTAGSKFRGNGEGVLHRQCG